MSNYSSFPGFGPRPGMPGGMPGGFNMPGNRPFGMGGPGPFPPQPNAMPGPGMAMMQQQQGPMPPFRRGPPPVTHMPRLGGPPLAGSFAGRPGGFPSGPMGGLSPSSITGGPSPSAATTVYVGKIAPSIPDGVIRELLEACGQIKSWNPVKEPSGQSKGFGFCEYEDGEGALRSLRLLNNLKVDGQELLLKPNTATQKYLVWYEQQKDAQRRQRAQAKAFEQDAKKEAEAAGEEKGVEEQEQDKTEEPEEEEEIDEAAQEQATDDLALTIIMGIVSSRSTPPPDAAAGDSRAESGDKKERDRESEKGHMSRDEWDCRRHSFSHAEDPEAARERAMEDEFKRERERKRRMEDEHRRREEREYQRRLEIWERHEREREREKEREKDRLRDLDRERARHIKADVEARESDDEIEPWQRRSLRSHRRMDERRKRRQREQDEDAADRAKEQQELAAAKAAADEQEPAAGSMQSPKAEEGAADKALSDSKQEAEDQKPGTSGRSADTAAVKPEENIDSKDEIFQAMLAAAAGTLPQKQSPPPATAASPGSGLQQQQQQQQGQSAPLASHRPTAGASLFGKRPNKAAVSALFGDDEDEGTKRRKLVPIKYTEEEMRAVEDHSQAVAEAAAGAAAAASRGALAGNDAQQQQQPQQQNGGTVPLYPPGLDIAGRKAFLRQWMDTLPNTREALHAFPVRWQLMTDSSLANITAWVGKKVPELVGMEEPDLVEFITALVRRQAPAETMESELEPILANDTPSFVMKLKRMIIYECERTALMSMP